MNPHEPNQPTEKPFLVRGVVTYANGSPAASLTVQVFDRDLRSEQLLGKTQTNDRGDYLIHYTAKQFRRAEKESADLLVRVVDAQGEVLYDPGLDGVLFNAPPEAVIDIQLAVEEPIRLSEFERLLADLRPLLEETPLESLREDKEVRDITFLHGETGWPVDRLEQLVVAHRLQQVSKISPAIFYGLLRQGQPLRSNLSIALQTGFTVSLQSEVKPLFYAIVLMEEVEIKAAMSRSIRAGIVPATLEKELDEVLRQLNQYHDEAAAYFKEQQPQQLLDLLQANVGGGQAEEVLKILQTEDLSDLPRLLNKLSAVEPVRTPPTGEKPAGDKPTTGKAAAALSLADLLVSDENLIQQAMEAQHITSLDEVSRLAALSPTDWRTMLKKVAKKRQPEVKPNANLVHLHASKLVRRMEKEYPQQAFNAQLERDPANPLPYAEALRAALRDDPSFDLRTANLDVYFREKQVTAEAGAEAPAGLEELKAAQRIFKLAPTYRQTNTLLAENVHSAYSIAQMGEARFVKRFGEGAAFSKSEARKVYRKALDTHHASLLLAGELLSYTHSPALAALDTVPSTELLAAITKDFPNLKTLFQGIDLCQCEHCRSIFGPAAYLVDVLEFLKAREVFDYTVSPPMPNNAKAELFKRRPDIGDLDLSCANSLTPLPYLDLVNELLEEATFPTPGILYDGPLAAGKAPAGLVSGLQTSGLPITPAAIVYAPIPPKTEYMLRDEKLACKITPSGGKWVVYRLRQTFAEAEELAAAPEYLNESAYEVLRLNKFAFRLPFDLFHQEARGYCNQFGIPRASLMRALQTPAGPLEAQIAAEQLGISEAERTLIVTPDPANQKTYWNTAAIPASGEMQVVDMFLQKSELTYAELERLLKLPFIDPAGKLFIQHQDVTCDTAKKVITNLDDDALDRMHRFLRLRRRLGWELEALDQAVMADKIGGETLDCLPALANLQTLCETLKLPAEQVIAFFSYLPYTGSRSAYARIFVNKSANGFIEEGLKAQAVLDNEALPPATQKKLAIYQDKLALILGMTPGELGQWIAALGVDPPVSMPNLAALVAYKRLSKALKLSVEEFLILQALCGVKPLDGPQPALDFIAWAERLRQTGMKPSELRYLLLHEATNLAERELPEKDITAWLKNLQKGYQNAFGESRHTFDLAQTADENKAGLRERLSRLINLSETDLTFFMDLVDGVWRPPALTPHAFLDNRLLPYMDTTAVKAAQTAVGLGPGVIDSKPAERNAFILVIQDGLAEYFYRQAKAALLAKTAADFKGGERLTAALLSEARLKEPPAAGNKTLGELLGGNELVDLNPNPTPPAVTPAAFPHQFASVRLLHKLAPYVAALGISAEELTWLLRNCKELDWMELDRLPYQSGLPAIPLAKWQALNEALRLVKQLPPIVNPTDNLNPITFYGFMELVLNPVTTPAQAIAYLSRLTGWDEAVTTALDVRFGFSVPNLKAYRDPNNLRRLETAAVLLRRLGVSVPQTVSFIQATLTLAEVTALRQALKSKTSDADWLGVLRSIQDPLREQKRDALVAYLLAMNPELKGSNDLYDYFLIDTQMSACQPTSRIVQAHGAVQLFIQRCLLGLERTAVAKSSKTESGREVEWGQWEWMKNYRVWEANRKVFVYPENWIEPELRDEKSPFFIDIENYLKQNELNDRNVEDAATGYLEKLDEVALMEVQAVYYETDIYTMHVFSRTRGGDPYTYYYRRFERERSWTPWEKVDLDISGDNLMAFVRNRRLFLAWPIFTDEANLEQSIPLPAQSDFGSSQAPRNQRRWKIQMAVSEYNGKKWLPKKVSREALYSGDWSDTLPYRDKFHFLPLDLAGKSFIILCTYRDDGEISRRWMGYFRLTGCKGVPVPVDKPDSIFPFSFLPAFKETELTFQRFFEHRTSPDDDLSIRTVFNPNIPRPILYNTVNGFRITYPFQMSLVDQILAFFYALLALYQANIYKNYNFGMDWREWWRILLPLGTFMPFFQEDYNRSYVVVPGFFKKKYAGNVPPPGKTFTDILEFTEDGVRLFLIYWNKLMQDPAHDLNKVLEELSKDDLFTDWWERFKEFWASKPGFQYKNFYHPLVCFLREVLYKDGIPGLMHPDVQMKDTGFDFTLVENYRPAPITKMPYPREDIDFALDGGYSSYNWEMFFHLPFEVAVRLSHDQQFEAAMTWFHYIFNPLGARDGDPPKNYWVTKPFFQHEISDYKNQLIDEILYRLATKSFVDDLEDAVAEWRNKPFKPHVIARSRPVAYQRAVVMKYIDNLIAWGDYLFRQDTMESINQAIQLYVLADRLLGPKPRIVPPAVETPPETYNQLEPQLDAFSNALLGLENLVPDLGLLPEGGAELPAPASFNSLYFCIPPNEQMLAYWDRVGDRLFKIRHCMNIEGVERQLALFSPPIDPGALVRAAAAGLSVADILAGMNAPLPVYRFKVMLQKARELAQQVNALGAGLLQALEKRDSEKLGLLHSSQEIQLLELVKLIKEFQVQDAGLQIEALNRSIEVNQFRVEYYQGREFMNDSESTAQDLNALAGGLQAAATAADIVATIAHLIPDINAGASGFGGTPHATVKYGGINFGNSSMSVADMLRGLAGIFQNQAGMLATLGSYQRRKDEWDFQKGLAEKDIKQLEKQVEAASIRLSLAEQDVLNQEAQIEQAWTVDAYLHDKFTNDELYDWMVGQISAAYFQAYQLALNVAHQAERCYRHELGRDDTFIASSYWDNLRKGLLAADQLINDLNRMETSYLERNKREYELTKTVSLALLDPLALAQLKTKGKCTINLPEAIFDLDHPGHYFRRLKAVSMSLPCIAGPYTMVSAKLSLVSNKYRKNTVNPGSYAEDTGNDDRFAYNLLGIQSIATSRAVEDSGLFVLDFQDERYLPFEGAGAISTWQLELPEKFHQFDYDTITDVLIHLKYTARDGGSAFKTAVETALMDLLNEMVITASETGLYRAFSLRREFPDAFYRFKTDKTLTMQLKASMLPIFTEGHTPAVEATTLLAQLKGSPGSYALTLDGAAINLTAKTVFANLLCTETPLPNPLALDTDFTLTAAATDDLEDLIIAIKYTLAS